MQQNTEAQMADLLEWRQRLESTHKQLLDAMTELITIAVGLTPISADNTHGVSCVLL
jgi:hypothetical protein